MEVENPSEMDAEGHTTSQTIVDCRSATEVSGMVPTIVGNPTVVDRDATEVSGMVPTNVGSPNVWEVADRNATVR
jgi:hypothetical protein